MHEPGHPIAQRSALYKKTLLLAKLGALLGNPESFSQEEDQRDEGDEGPSVVGVEVSAGLIEDVLVETLMPRPDGVSADV
jgi:hypothetical protein